MTGASLVSAVVDPSQGSLVEWSVSDRENRAEVKR
jgi:hypothetical protein